LISGRVSETSLQTGGLEAADAEGYPT
jgi:hypothetical protein